ncbi:MAG TPA: FHA domain-containing serine/threonine-protein kinase [Planctomycetota bacterium]|nr:FHA domain-containing serine/threonine-protein kinase [Planctomycetota bacterium]
MLPHTDDDASALIAAARLRGTTDDPAVAAVAEELAAAGAGWRARLIERSRGEPAVDRLRALLPPGGLAIGAYRPLALVADCGTSHVWLARRDQVSPLVVVKVLRPELAPSVEFERRFAREIGIARGFDHPHLVRCLDHGRDRDHVPYIVLELVSGGDLKRLLTRERRLDEARALTIALGVARGLEHAHRAGLLHRDIKPANILLDANGAAKLGDFGFAAAQIDQGLLTMRGVVMGTPHYLAPEQARGERIDGRADTYALGCVLFAMLAGTPPFTGDADSILRQHVHAPIPDVRRAAPATSEATAKLILKCLAKDPASRYASAAALVASLERNLAAIGAVAAAPAARPESATLVADAGADALAGDLRQAFAGEWLTLVDERLRDGAVIALWARDRITLGSRMGAPTDCCLRVYPAADHADACRRISQAHLALGVDDQGAFVEDLASTNGTRADGELLTAPRRLGAATTRVAIDGALALDVRAIPRSGPAVRALAGSPDPRRDAALGLESSAACDALVATRIDNRPRLAYALVLRRLAIGGDDGLPVAGHRGGDRLIVARWHGRWLWRARDGWPWLPLAVGDCLTLGSMRLLARAGDWADLT